MLAHRAIRSATGPGRALSRGALAAVAALAATFPGYLVLLLLAAAADRLAPRRPHDDRRMRLAVLVPAHDEERSIGRLLASLHAAEYPRDLLEIVVVADNCSDDTADVARRGGARVCVRDDPDRRGKGYALAHGVAVIRSRPEPKAIVVVDADCEVTSNFLTEIAGAIARGATVVQTDNQASGPVRWSATGLAGIGVLLMNRVRPRGKQRLGLSAGLLGTGMAFTMAAADVIDWDRPTLAEDLEQHVMLVLAGHRVTYAGDACVISALAGSPDGWRDQQARWEAGRWQAVRHYVPRLVLHGLRAGDPQAVFTGLDLLVPPQSVIAALNAATGLAGILSGDRRARRRSAFGLLAQGVFVLGGMLVAGAPAHSYLALAHAPALVARKLRLYASLRRGRAPMEWIRAERPGASAVPGSG